MIAERGVDGQRALVLGGEGPDAIEASFVQSAGMVCCSLLHRGEELLGQRGGLARYVAARSTMGIPLLHPWANRLAEKRFPVAGGEVDLQRQPDLVKLDPNGLPIHGLLSAAPGWNVERHEAQASGATLEAGFDFAAHEDLIDAFPFPHEVRIKARVAGQTLTIATTVRATGDGPVPVSFGYHPYFKLPGVDRSSWEVRIPVGERIVLDRQGLPTGAVENAAVEDGALGSRTFDDLFGAPEGAAPFLLEGGERRIEVAFLEGYPYAQVYAPDNDDVIAFEPMTAPTNALVSGDGLQLLEPGEAYGASFSIAVSGR